MPEHPACRRLRMSCQLIIDLISSAEETPADERHADHSEPVDYDDDKVSQGQGCRVLREAYMRLEQIVNDRAELLRQVSSGKDDAPAELADSFELVQLAANVVEHKVWDCISDCLTLAQTRPVLLREAVSVLILDSEARHSLFAGDLGPPSSLLSPSCTSLDASARTDTRNVTATSASDAAIASDSASSNTSKIGKKRSSKSAINAAAAAATKVANDKGARLGTCSSVISIDF